MEEKLMKKMNRSGGVKQKRCGGGFVVKFNSSTSSLNWKNIFYNVKNIFYIN